MYFHIPGTINLSITDTKEFCYDDGAPVNLRIDGSKVELFRCGRLEWYDIEFVYLCSLYEVPVFVDWNDVRFVAFKNVQNRFQFRAVLLKPYYLDSQRKLRACLGYPRLGVAENGDIYSLTRNQWVPHTIDNGGYHYVSAYKAVTRDNGKARVSLLVATAWVQKSIFDAECSTVNHIDGNTNNNHASNLEWMPAVENTLDGAERTKKKRNVIGRIRDITTGSIYEFYSYTDMGKFLNMSSVHSKNKLANAAENKLFSKKYEVRLIGDTRPWYYNDVNTDRSYGHSKYVISVIEPDGTNRVFNGPLRLKQFYGLRSAEHDFESIVKLFQEKFPMYQITWRYLQRSSPIEALNTNTGETVVFKNVPEAVRKTGVTPDRVRYSVASGGRTCSNGWRFRSQSSDSWPEEVTETVGKKSVYKLTCKTTGKVYYFKSLKNMSSFSGMSRRSLHRILSEPSEQDSYVVEIINHTDIDKNVNVL